MKKLFFIFCLVPLLLSCKKDNVIEDKNIVEECTERKEKVLLIGIDGCRTDAFLQIEHAAFDSLMEQAYVNFNVDRGPHTWSGPGWASILRGVWPSKHKLTSNFIVGHDFGKWHDMFYYLKQYNPYLYLAAVSNWSDFLKLITKKDFSKPVHSDFRVTETAQELLAEECAPDVLLLHYDDVDYAGHTTGFSPNNSLYMEALRQTGDYVGELMQTIIAREKKYDEKWMVILATDHGGSGRMHEFLDNKSSVRYVFTVVRVPGMNRIELPEVENVDLMPTMMKFLSVPVREAWSLDGKAIY